MEESSEHLNRKAIDFSGSMHSVAGYIGVVTALVRCMGLFSGVVWCFLPSISSFLAFSFITACIVGFGGCPSFLLVCILLVSLVCNVSGYHGMTLNQLTLGKV